METYKNILDRVGNFLKHHNYGKKGNTFYRFEKNNWMLINFQKSVSSSPRKVLFTINVGICSTALRKTLNEIPQNVKPIIDDCHWQKRIGYIMAQKQDIWWEVNNNADIEGLANNILLIIDTFVFPEIEQYVSDESLEKEWLNERMAGLTDLQRYIYLTTLLKLNNKNELLVVVEKMKAFSKGKSFEYTIYEHIKELENIQPI